LIQYREGLLRHFVRRILPLRNDALQVHPHDLLEQKTAIRFDVIEA